MHTIGEFLLLFLVGLSSALVGWGIVVIASRIERERQERHAKRYGTDTVPRRAKPFLGG
jgi:hypothetical protein